MNLVIDYPWWIYFICLFAGACYAFVLYGKTKSKLDRKTFLILFTLRLLSVSLLALLLFSPLWKHIRKEIERPVIIIAQDNSESVVLSKDSSFYKHEFSKNVQLVSQELQKDHEVVFYTFGSRTQKKESPDFTEKHTNISAFLSDLQRQYAFRNVGALVLVFDGLYNRGYSPTNQIETSSYPIYTVAMGDTAVKKDLALGNISYPRMTYVGSNFPVEIFVRAQKFPDNRATLRIEYGGKSVYEEKILITQNEFLTTTRAILTADKAGLQRFTVSISNLKGEVTYANNTEHFFVDVLDDRRSILLLHATPHPDITALKQTMEHNAGYRITSKWIKDYQKNDSIYDLVVLHQLPSERYPIKDLLNHWKSAKTPLLFVLSTETSFPEFNQLKAGISLSAHQKNSDDATADVNSSFTLFSIDENEAEILKNFPPLVVPFGNYTLNGNTQVFCFQKIGNVQTERPLIAFSQNEDQRFGVIAGEGLWKWKLSDFAQNGTHAHFNNLINKAIQFTAKKEDKSRFRIIHPPIFDASEPVVLEAELYNEVYELIQTPDIKITLKDTVGNEYPYLFDRTANAYKLIVGFLPMGYYSYQAKVKWGEKELSKGGSFIVNASNIESANLTADHNLLYTLAQKTGGEMLSPRELNSLIDLIAKQKDNKPVSFESIHYDDLLNIPWVMILLLLLLGTEWFIRKYNGLI